MRIIYDLKIDEEIDYDKVTYFFNKIIQIRKTQKSLEKMKNLSWFKKFINNFIENSKDKKMILLKKNLHKILIILVFQDFQFPPLAYLVKYEVYPLPEIFDDDDPWYPLVPLVP